MAKLTDAFFRWDKATKAILNNSKKRNGHIGRYEINNSDKKKLQRNAADFAIRMRGQKNKNIKRTFVALAKTVDSDTYLDLWEQHKDLRDTNFSETPASPMIRGIVKRVLTQYKGQKQ